MYIEQIKRPNDIKKLSPNALNILANEIRCFLIESISQTGGHLAPNLGVIELTIALHMCCNLPKDKIIWDVGHQSYTHKILTGRREQFATLRQFKGLSGFPKREESDCDSFDTGHSATSISAGLGYVHARELKHEHYKVISVIGDGALTGGLAYEAINNASQIDSNFIIVLNDNNMSISPNVGGVSSLLTDVRTAPLYQDLKESVVRGLERMPGGGETTIRSIRRMKSSIKQLMIPGMVFEEMGITYIGPIDGSDITKMRRAITEASKVEGPVLVHAVTKKGKGYGPAERHPARFHGTAPFDIETGIPLKKHSSTYTDIFSTVMRKMGDREENVVAITAAMEDGTGLRRFHNMFPNRFFDVGIAEQHGVTFAAGLATAGMIPVFAVYSSFLQRAYDQLIGDVCMQKLHVVFAIDRAGLVGSDGQTHHGCFDLSYLGAMPGMVVMAPKNLWELSDMMKFAIQYEGPIALRYPRGKAYKGYKTKRAIIELGKSENLCEGSQVALVAVGSMVEIAAEVGEKLKEDGIQPTIVNARFVKPFDKERIEELANNHQLIVTMEENVASGGFGQKVAAYCMNHDLDVRIRNVTIPDQFIEQGAVELLHKEAGLDKDTIYDSICQWLKE